MPEADEEADGVADAEDDALADGRADALDPDGLGDAVSGTQALRPSVSAAAPASATVGRRRRRRRVVMSFRIRAPSRRRGRPARLGLTTVSSEPANTAPATPARRTYSYLGPAGTFTEAALSQVPEARDQIWRPVRNVGEALADVVE